MEIVHTVGQKQKDDSGSVADKGTPKHGVDDEGIISDGISGKGVSEPWTQTTHRTKPRDDQFYLRSAIFEVEDVLFQLPIANFVQESEVFKTLFEVPQPSSPNSTSAEREDPNGVEHDVEGATDANPIRLVGVKKDDFKNLVRVMYARAYADEEILSEAQWTSVLVLSERWDMPRLQALAIAKLTPALARDPHKMAVMGRVYDVSSWLISGIHALVVRPEPPMGLIDAQRLGVEEALKVAEIREWTLRWKLVHRDSTEWILNRQEMPPYRDIVKKIREEFGLREED
ncbi:hypothetical protein D9619_002115 [Psilocybe cf. subviscida]|uniref:BTB domain-containing protein n=1 Tax=Psilocybe cf. subviscida TaxID=2480587 RepID=A0A8H5BCW7_9AGAR|nr:hypothetical protein D9619_002115 [Psilocybe cf. subviscida]